MTNGTDAVRHHFMQSHLLLGLYPSVPIKDNDHQIQPATRADLFYKRYGPLWSALSGKRWLTTAHAVSVVLPKDGVRANAFERRPFGSGQYAVAVAFAAGAKRKRDDSRRAARDATRRCLSRHTYASIAIRAVATLIDGVQVLCATSQSVAHPPGWIWLCPWAKEAALWLRSQCLKSRCSSHGVALESGIYGNGRPATYGCTCICSSRRRGVL